MATSGTWTVIVMDNFHSFDDTDDVIIGGFPTEELATEYARRRTRNSIEEMRAGMGEAGDNGVMVRARWRTFGESAVVQGPAGPPNITLEDEREEWFGTPATQAECDYESVATANGARQI